MEIEPTNRAFTEDFELLTRADLQKLFRVCGRTISRLTASGKLPPPILVGNRERWQVEQIRHFINTQRGIAIREE